MVGIVIKAIKLAGAGEMPVNSDLNVIGTVRVE
jgi:hypothetical protein